MRKETSTNFENENSLHELCNGAKTLQLISGRWKLPVLFYLLNNSKGYFSDFRNLLPSASDRMLALHLNQMVSDGLITKKQRQKTISYRLTEKGGALDALLKHLASFQIPA